VTAMGKLVLGSRKLAVRREGKTSTILFYVDNHVVARRQLDKAAERHYSLMLVSLCNMKEGISQPGSNR